MDPIILFSAPDNVPNAGQCSALAGYLSKTYGSARRQHVRVDTVNHHVFVVMDVPLTDEDSQMYGIIRGVADAFAAGWGACVQAASREE